MRVEITAFDPPTYFQDAMVKGPFRSFRHDHFFAQEAQGTLMVDRIVFASPIPLLGKIADILVLQVHLQRLLETRNRALKITAESDQWRKYLPSQV
jgi:ligand-binding SRPBCC domain-containing protein